MLSSGRPSDFAGKGSAGAALACPCRATPPNPLTPRPCARAPLLLRTGSAACRYCRAGSFPTKSASALAAGTGADQCTLCPLGFYRGSFSNRCAGRRALAPAGGVLPGVGGCVRGWVGAGVRGWGGAGARGARSFAWGRTSLNSACAWPTPLCRALCDACPAGYQTKVEAGATECTSCSPGGANPQAAYSSGDASLQPYVGTQATYSSTCSMCQVTAASPRPSGSCRGVGEGGRGMVWAQARQCPAPRSHARPWCPPPPPPAPLPAQHLPALPWAGSVPAVPARHKHGWPEQHHLQAVPARHLLTHLQ